jgi:hypothetical protein
MLCLLGITPRIFQKASYAFKGTFIGLFLRVRSMENCNYPIQNNVDS